MPLPVGARLGPYEILSALGAGGMGEVYRARDTRLGRDVAVKVLPAGLSADPERLQRFEQEARAAAALNHPNILALYDIGSHDPSPGSGQAGAPYLVTELLEGATLREQMGIAALPVRRAIDYAIQIAHGLAAAHEKGIVHRDLKPENVFVTDDGRVKILDFGLAKLTQPEPAMAGVTALPTTPPNTLAGVVLGTIGYMSPEQVRGVAADHRADIFAFGAVLYEMLSGTRAFHGETAMDAMTAIVKDYPADLPAIERKIPPALVRIVDRCLEKSPGARFQSTRDLAFALEALSSSPSSSDVGPKAVDDPASRVRNSTRERLAWVAALVLTAAIVGSSVLFLTRPTIEPPGTVRFEVVAPAGFEIPQTAPATVLSLSPDGRRLVFPVVRADGQTQALALRSLDAIAPQVLPATEMPRVTLQPFLPFWSPDSRFIGFFGQGKLKKIDVSGGAAQVLCDAAAPDGATWNRDGTIVFASGPTGGLVRVSSTGGTPAPVTTLDANKQERSHRFPSFLPDGRHFLYVSTGMSPTKIYVGSLDSKDRIELVSSDTRALFADGHLLFVRQGTLLAQPFDDRTLKLTGEAFPMADDVGWSAVNARAAFSASVTGVIAYRAGSASSVPSQLAWFDRTGKQLGAVGDRSDQGGIQLSQDATRAAITVLDATRNTRDLHIYDLTRDGLRTRFTFDPAEDMFPVWSPDGSTIAFNSNRSGRMVIYRKNASGVGADDLLLDDPLHTVYPNSWSADGRFLLFTTGRADSPTTGNDIWVLALTGDRKPIPIVQTPFDEARANFSPDGRWVVYQSNESGGRDEIFVVPFSAPGANVQGSSLPAGKTQVSSAGGSQARWRRDGKELFYLAADNKLMAVEVDGQGAVFKVRQVRPLFDAHARTPAYRSFQFGWNYDVSLDGQHFLINTVTEQAVPSPITVVMNWTAGLRK